MLPERKKGRVDNISRKMAFFTVTITQSLLIGFKVILIFIYFYLINGHILT